MKCKYCNYKENIAYQKMYCFGFMGRLCPQNTDKNCNIKPKKLVRVKAWAQIQTVWPPDGKKEYKEVRCVDMLMDKCFESVPCTILIDKKYLKEK